MAKSRVSNMMVIIFIWSTLVSVILLHPISNYSVWELNIYSVWVLIIITLQAKLTSKEEEICIWKDSRSELMTGGTGTRFLTWALDGHEKPYASRICGCYNDCNHERAN